MSFRSDESRRYGHVPPAQYPVAPPPQEPAGYPARRPSFNSGDDANFFEQPAARPQQLYTAVGSGRADEELFITSPTAENHSAGNRASYIPQNAAAASYQRQYQVQVPPPPPSHSTYNPQTFARSQSASLPYHPAQNLRHTPSSPTYAAPPTNYTPQAYNPAAYANTNAAVPQRHSTVAGYTNYGYGNYNTPPVPHVSTAYVAPPSSTYGGSQPSSATTPSAPQRYEPALHSPQYAPTAAQPPVAPQYEPSYSAGYGAQQYSGGGYAGNGVTAAPSSHVPYPVHSQIPVGPNYSPDPNSFSNRVSRSGSQPSPVPSPPSRSQASPQISRHPTNAPLPSRPMDDLPEEPDWGVNGGGEDDFQVTQDTLIQDIVSDLGVSPHSQRPQLANGTGSDDILGKAQRYNSTSSRTTSDPGVNRYPSNASSAMNNTGASTNTTYTWDSEESDPEGAAGLLAMQDDMDDRRFGGITFPAYMEPLAPAQQLQQQTQEPQQQQPPPPPPQQPPQQQLQQYSQTPSPLPPPPEEQPGTDSDYGGTMDLAMYGGGYAGNLHYGNELGSPPTTSHSQDAPRPLPTPQGHGAEHPPFSDVSVDYGGTGGLLPPQTHRLSFDDGDERVSLHSRHSGSDSPSKEDYPYDQMFWHPGLSSRPLPALPPQTPDGNSQLSPQPSVRSNYQHNHSLSADSRLPYPPDTPEARHEQNLTQQQQVERSISLSSHSNTPPIQAPARSRTDAAEERRRATKHMSQPQAQAYQQSATTPYEGYEAGTPSSMAAYDMITLPTGRRKKFVPSKLTAADIKRCAEPWALSGITSWIREMAEGEPDLKRKTIEEGVLKLFCAKVPTMNVADAELLSARVVDSMFSAGILTPEEEWVKFGTGQLSGVLWQLTGSGCFAPKLHEDEGIAPRLHGNGIPVRCYSHHCGRTLKKANLDNMMSEEDVVVLDWATFHGVTKDDIKSKHKKEVERQNVLHEIVTGEEDYMGQLDVLRLLYRDWLRAWQPPIIAANRMDKFLDAVFGRVDAVQQINKEHLLAQLKYRQQEQGPWIVGFSDLFREWIRKARPIYVEYCSSFPYASYLVRKEASRNLLFRQFLDVVRDHKRSKRLEWTTFVKAPITRLQRYGLLLETVKKNMPEESEEKHNLERALEEIKKVTHECDEKVAEMTRKVELLELQSMLVLRPGFQSVLNLDHLGRELLKQGDLQRQGSKGVRWVDTHALLFDHYFILSKAVPSKDGRSDKKYDVSKEPIPMPLLFLESLNDDPVAKQKSLTAPLTRTTATTGSGTQLNKVASNGERPGIEHTATGSSIASLNTVSRLTSVTADDGKIIYPFRIKHLGHEIYTLYASTAQERATWCSAIIEAKTRHARALHAQNAEPFRLRVISDCAFAYDSASPLGRQPSVSIRGTPLDRAIREMEQTHGPGRGPPPVSRATVNCACAFTSFGKSLIAIGTDYGVYISEVSNARGWVRSVQISKVTQIAVLEEFSVCLLIADRSLISYPLDVIAPVSNFAAPSHDNPRRAPQRLAKDVAFFATARMKDRMLLFYKRKEGMHNTFKVLEPVFQKATEKRSRLFSSRRAGAGATESFRDYDAFYIPTDCFSLNLFQNYIAVATSKGFELLTLDKKVTQSIPRDLSQPAIANIASRIKEPHPLGMFKLNDQEFLLTYGDCAVYVDKHGEISRTLIMEYSGKQRKAKAATMFGQYLLLFNDDYVEVRNAENGRLRQIIAGRDVRCLDYGFRGPTGSGAQAGLQPPAQQDSKGTVKICMSHPEIPGGQIVLEMLLNDGHAE